MKNIFVYLIVLLTTSIMVLTGCSTNTQKENTAVGAVGGAVLGGLAGSAIGAGTGQVVAIGVGAIAGALIGGAIGHSMDSSDNKMLCDTLNNNKTYHSSTWTNDKTGATYTVTPTSSIMPYKNNNTCRRYKTKAIISGKKQMVTGIACRQSDGTWMTVN